MSKQITVADAITNPDVRAGKLYFRALDRGANDPNAMALYRLYSDGAQALLGGARWITLQKLTEYHDPRPNIAPVPWWSALGSSCDIDWLITPAEFVESADIDENKEAKRERRL